MDLSGPLFISGADMIFIVKGNRDSIEAEDYFGMFAGFAKDPKNAAILTGGSRGSKAFEKIEKRIRRAGFFP